MDSWLAQSKLRYENETLKNKIETEKDHIKTNVQMLRYVIMESLFREFFNKTSKYLGKYSKIASKMINK